MGNSSEKIVVEVAYALPDRQEIIELSVASGCTALEAVEQSGIVNSFPDIDLENAQMGIFSKSLDGKVQALPKDYKLVEKDRVEIYRPLLIDPKQARLERAEKAKKLKAAQAIEKSDAAKVGDGKP